jgi:hypothetical protein
MQYDSKTFIPQFDNFKEIFNNIKNYIYSEDSANVANPQNSVKYGALFKLGYESDKRGFKTNLMINPTFYTGKNMWLVKAIDLNRGRCIKIGNEINEIKQIIRNFYEGIYKSFKKEKEEEKKRTLTGNINQEKVTKSEEKEREKEKDSVGLNEKENEKKKCL